MWVLEVAPPTGVFLETTPLPVLWTPPPGSENVPRVGGVGLIQLLPMNQSLALAWTTLSPSFGGPSGSSASQVHVQVFICW